MRTQLVKKLSEANLHNWILQRKVSHAANTCLNRLIELYIGNFQALEANESLLKCKRELAAMELKLQVADMHYANGKITKCLDVFSYQEATCSDLNTTAFIYRMIEAENPDLIVFTGDNIFGYDTGNPALSLEMAFDPAIKSKIPWATVLGNHDQECTLGRAEVMKHIVKMDYTLPKLNPENIHIDCFGNYNLQVMGSIGSSVEHKSALNLYLVDSGDYSSDTSYFVYDWVKESQRAWLKQISNQMQQTYKAAPNAQVSSAPALVFFHIPLPEVSSMDAPQVVGQRQEKSGNAAYNSGVFNTLVRTGDVKAAFTGHDHVNDFCGELQGIHLCYGGGFGYHAYGMAGWSRRARVIIASLQRDHKNKSWSGVRRITTWKCLDDPYLGKIDHQFLWTK